MPNKCEFRNIVKHSHWFFFILFIVFLVAGLYKYFQTDHQVIHFSKIAIPQKISKHFKPIVAINGQYKTEGKEFLVGENITISAHIYLNIDKDYQKIKNLPVKIKFIENTEDSNELSTDIDKNFRQKGISGINIGTLEIVEFNDEKNLIKIYGKVKAINEGKIYFISPQANSDPIGTLLRSYGLKENGVYVSPRHIKYQIETNEILLLLTFIVVSLTFLMLFIQSNGNKK